jgi:hypothetical protein
VSSAVVKKIASKQKAKHLYAKKVNGLILSPTLSEKAMLEDSPFNFPRFLKRLDVRDIRLHFS